jgi:hypothetical protein
LWSGENNARDSIGTNDGQLVNVTFARGVVGRAFHLNGSNACVRIPDSPVLKPTDLTVEAWVKFDALESHRSNLPGYQTIVFKLNSRDPHRGNFDGYSLFKNTNQFGFGVASADGREVHAYSLTVPRVGEWYHVAGTYNSFNTNLEIYVNGVLEGSAHADFPLDCGTRPLFVGTTGEWWDSSLQGTVDEVAFYYRALLVNEIHDDYEAIRSKSSQLAQAGSTTDSANSNAVETTENELSATARKSLVARWSPAQSGGDSAGTNDAVLEHVTVSETEVGGPLSSTAPMRQSGFPPVPASAWDRVMALRFPHGSNQIRFLYWQPAIGFLHRHLFPGADGRDRDAQPRFDRR